MILISFRIEKNYNPLLLPSHLTSCTPTTSISC